MQIDAFDRDFEMAECVHMPFDGTRLNRGPPRGPPGGPHRGPPAPPDPNGPPRGLNRGIFGRGPPPPPPPPGHQGGGLFRIPRAFNPTPYHFDPKLKTDDIPEWDGNPDTLLRWIKKVQEIANRSAYCHEQIGLLAPARFKGRADQWYRFLEPGYKQQIQTDWDTLRVAVSRHFLNLHWFNTQTTKALAASYRQSGHHSERPTDYFYRKLELLQTVNDWTDLQLIQEILKNAPDYWKTIINTTNMTDLMQLQDALQLHEHTLLKDPRNPSSVSAITITTFTIIFII